MIRRFKNHRRQSGNALVEFGVVSTLLFSFTFGIVDFGRALYTYHYVSNAAREGARYAMVRGSTSASPATQNSISDYLKNTPLGIDPARMTVTATFEPNNQPGSTAKVTVEYDFKFIMPYLPSGTVNMKSTSQMVIAH